MLHSFQTRHYKRCFFAITNSCILNSNNLASAKTFFDFDALGSPKKGRMEIVESCLLPQADNEFGFRHDSREI